MDNSRRVLSDSKEIYATLLHQFTETSSTSDICETAGSEDCYDGIQRQSDKDIMRCDIAILVDKVADILIRCKGRNSPELVVCPMKYIYPHV